MLIKRDQPYVYLVYPRRSMAFNADIWDPIPIVEEAGIGIRNVWTFMQAKPLGAQKDMILNSPQPISNAYSGAHGPDRQLGQRPDLGSPDARGHPRRPGSLGGGIGEIYRSGHGRGSDA